MATGIEWTDETWNPVTGCSKVSPGCAHCYAEGVADRFWAKQYPLVTYLTCSEAAGCTHEGGLVNAPCRPFLESRGRRFTDVRCHEDRLDQPLRWKQPRRIFVNSMSDLFHEDVPDAFIDKVFAVMALATRHTFQILTKRPQRMLHYLTASVDEEGRGVRQRVGLDAFAMVLDAYPKRISDGGSTISGEEGRQGEFTVWPRPNVWLGVSVENQRFADERIPLLLQTPAAVRFISAEPLLGPVDLKRHMPKPMFYCGGCGKEKFRPYCSPCGRELETVTNEIVGLDWVIVGGESGPGARPFEAAWARSIVRQCQAAGVSVFVKQLGANVRDRNDAGFEGDFDGSGTAWPEHLAIEDRVEDHPNGYREDFQGAPVRLHLRDKKGGDPSEWPEDLRVRQFPKETVHAD